MNAVQHHFAVGHVARGIGRRGRVAVEAATIDPHGRPAIERLAVCEGTGAQRTAALLAAAPQLLAACRTAYAMCEAQGAQDSEVARMLRRAIQAAQP